MSGFSCNGCHIAELRKRLGKRFLMVLNEDIPTVYEIGAEPLQSQDEPREYLGRPIRFIASYIDVEHRLDRWCHYTRGASGELQHQRLTRTRQEG